MLLAGCVAAVLAWWFLRSAAKADPTRLARMARRGGGFAALAVAAVLGARGRLDMALLAGGIGAWLLDWSGGLWGWLRGRTGIGVASNARIRSATIELDRDPQTGRLGGAVVAGPWSGRRLDDLLLPELLELRRACSGGDPQGRQLVEQYLDGRAPCWREHAEGDADARGRSDPERRPMSEQEAYEVLGLQPGADADAVRSAHRALIKRLHPDQGGSTYLASRVNQAKDILLDRHR